MSYGVPKKKNPLAVNLATGLMNGILPSYDGEDIDWGTAPPRPTIRPGGGQTGGWPTNPKSGVIGRGGKPAPVGGKKKKPKGGNNKFAV